MPEIAVSRIRISIQDGRAALGRASADVAARALLDACTRKAAATLVVATGSSLKYQWRKNNIALVEGANGITGTTSATLTLAAADPGSDTDAGSAGRYDVVVSNSVNNLTSLPATLTVTVSTI